MTTREGPATAPLDVSIMTYHHVCDSLQKLAFTRRTAHYVAWGKLPGLSWQNTKRFLALLYA
jgi:hypothetical protein